MLILTIFKIMSKLTQSITLLTCNLQKPSWHLVLDMDILNVYFYSCTHFIHVIAGTLLECLTLVEDT